MRKTLNYILIVFVMMSAFLPTQAIAQSDVKQEEEPKKEEATRPGPFMAFQELIHDFGDITQGDKVKHTFTFENSGDAPLIISDIRVTCGCTATDWPRDPIPPGKEASITVQFNSAGKLGKQHKVVTIVSNATNPLPRLTITTNVKEKDSGGR